MLRVMISSMLVARNNSYSQASLHRACFANVMVWKSIFVGCGERVGGVGLLDFLEVLVPNAADTRLFKSLSPSKMGCRLFN